jgi:hypothetical protein
MTLQTVLEMKSAYARALGRPPWLRGVGVGQDAAGYFIKVNSSVPVRLPAYYGAVRIFVDVVGNITAL